MNLKDYYTAKQVFHIFGFKYRQQIKRWRNKYKVKPIRITGNYYYKKEEVDSIAYQLHGKFEHELRKLTDPTLLTVDLDLDEWGDWGSLNLSVNEWSGRALYFIKNRQKLAPQVRTRQFNGVTWFNKKDVEKYLDDIKD